MTKTKLFFTTIFCAFLSLQFASCSSDDSDDATGGGNDITGITLNKSTLSLEEGSSETLVATITPSGATGSIAWSSSDTSVATVDTNGAVSALKEGTASIAAAVGTFTAICNVTVSKEVVIIDSETLNGSDYYVIQLDDLSYANISDRVIQDFRPDDVDKNLFVWDNTFNAGTSVGTNFYGQDESWITLNVGSVGWSGAGFNAGAGFGTIDMTRMFDNPEDYYLHVGIKTGQASSSYLLILNDGVTEAKIAIGNDFIDGVTYPSYKPLVRDNTWNSIDIPVTHLNTLGLFYNQPFQDLNVLAFLAGGIQGTTLDMDAIFFYKK